MLAMAGGTAIGLMVGVFAARGPGIATGEVASLSLYDVAPTLLCLLGFPVAEDMPGKVATEAIDERFGTYRQRYGVSFEDR